MSLFDTQLNMETTKSGKSTSSPSSNDPLAKQVGGSHYKSMAIQPIEYCLANNLGILEHAVIKYVSRYKNKGGTEDLDKAIHYLELLKSFYSNARV